MLVLAVVLLVNPLKVTDWLLSILTFLLLLSFPRSLIKIKTVDQQNTDTLEHISHGQNKQKTD